MHFQKQYTYTKIVHVIKGIVFEVAVDLRAGFLTYGKYHGELLTEVNKKQFLIPLEFDQGFLVLSDIAELCCKCDGFYHANDEGGMTWNDPKIGIAWSEVIGDYAESVSASGYTLSEGIPLNLSEKDQQ